MSPLRCPRCGSARDADDNFCRRCGRQVTVTLPVVSEQRLPAESRAIPPSLVGSVAVLAIGTGLEWLARRMASGAGRAVARAAGQALVGKTNRSPPRQQSVVPADGVQVDEVVYIRQVRLRR